ncbi:hypothetical protein GGI42DRAFT_53417 [Trichoderma sp. SZMC 28013]
MLLPLFQAKKKRKKKARARLAGTCPPCPLNEPPQTACGKCHVPAAWSDHHFDFLNLHLFFAGVRHGSSGLLALPMSCINPFYILDSDGHGAQDADADADTSADQIDSYSYSYSSSHPLPRIKVHFCEINQSIPAPSHGWLAASLPLAKQQKALQTKQTRATFCPALSRASLFSRSAPPSQSRRGRPIARHTARTNPFARRAFLQSSSHTSGQTGNDPCAIARGSPGEPGELGSRPLSTLFLLVCSPREKRLAVGDDDGDMFPGPHNHCRTGFFFVSCGLLLSLCRARKGSSH